MRIAHPHKPIPAGLILSIDADGREEWATPRRVLTPGSFDSKMHIRSHGALVKKGFASELHIHGNPSKFMQGHNVWGTDDAIGLMSAVMERITSSLGIEPVSNTALATALVSRLDFTKSLQFENRQQVRAYLSQVSIRAHSRNGRPSTRGSTLYFQKGSKRHIVVCYSKGDELQVSSHQLPEGLPKREQVIEEADKLMRVELRIKGLELSDIGMRRLGDCTPKRLNEVYADYIGRIEMSTSTKIANDELKALGRAVGNTYLLHKEGVDVRSLMTESTFYRHRKKLLRYGIDIAVPMPSEGSAEIIPLHRVIKAQPYSPPQWAYESGLFFQPQKKVAN